MDYILKEKKMIDVIPHFIDGQKLQSQGRQLPVYQPAIGCVAKEVVVADQSVINHAVLVAKQAFLSWGATTPLQRAKILFRFKSLLDQHLKELAKIVTDEHGKTFTEAMGSVQRGIDVVDFACGIPNHLKGDFAAQVANGMDTYSLHQPLGVCVGITPFNFPAMIPLWMFTMAIACGNTFVLKPSEKDPSCSIRLVELAKEAGLPDGVLNIVQGEQETVTALITHADVEAVSFVGSSTVAEYVYQTAILHH